MNQKIELLKQADKRFSEGKSLLSIEKLEKISNDIRNNMINLEGGYKTLDEEKECYCKALYENNIVSEEERAEVILYSVQKRAGYWGWLGLKNNKNIKKGDIVVNQKIELLLLDIDGIMTNGTKVYNGEGLIISKSFCDLDFTAIKKFQSAGVLVYFMSSDTWNENIAKTRGIPFINSRSASGIIDKVYYFKKLKNELGIENEKIIYAGDDYFDISVMKEIFYKNNCFCPSCSPLEVKKHATALKRQGGDGLIMELFEHLLFLNRVKDCSVNH